MPTARATTSPLPSGEFVAGDPCSLPPKAGPTSQAIATLDRAIAAAFPNFGPLLKDGKNTYTKSRYIKPETLLNDVRSALMMQAVLISSCLELVKGGFVVTTTLTHSGGGWRASSFPIANPGDASKIPASATNWWPLEGQRINLLLLLAIVGREDDGQEDLAPGQQVQPLQQAPPVGQWQPPAAPQSAPYQASPFYSPAIPNPPVGQWQPPAAPQSCPQWLAEPLGELVNLA